MRDQEEVVSECPHCGKLHTEFCEAYEGHHVCIECYAEFMAEMFEKSPRLMGYTEDPENDQS